jgi:predicted permease
MDLRYGVRGLLRRPGFTALAVLTLALGIGVNTVAFSAVNALIFKPFRFDGSHELGWIMTKAPGNPYGQTSIPDYEDIARTTRTFAAVIAEMRWPLVYKSNGVADERWTMIVSSNYLETLRVEPEIGRLFTKADLAGGDLPAVVSHRFWNDHLGGGASTAGRTVTFNNYTYQIVGVLPDDFQGPMGVFEPDAWLPLERIDVLGLPASVKARGEQTLGLVGRMKPGIAPAQAEAELQSVMRQLAAEYPATNKEQRAAFYPMPEGHPEVRTFATGAWIALGILGVVLLIACFNVAGLLLARVSERQREIGVRAALGATRGRILRQLMTEGVMLAALSGAAALVVAVWSADLLSAFSLPSPIPQRLHMAVDRRLIGFTAALVLVAGLLPALVPALQATRADLLRSIRMESAIGGRPSRARNIFVVIQVAGSTLFLAAALLFVRSFINTASFDPGFDTAHTLVLELNPDTYGYDQSRSRVFFENLNARVAALPGVRHTALADRVPFYIGFPKSMEVSLDGTDCSAVKCRAATEYGIGPGYFSAMGIPLTGGRDFTDLDLEGGTGAIISQEMARQFWPGENAVGRSFRGGKDRRELHVIGVARDVKHRNMGEVIAPYVYRPLRDTDFGGAITLVIRSAGDPRSLIVPVQEQVHALDPNLPARSVQPMSKRMETPLWPARAIAGFFVVCGTLALVLATVGLFGVTYYAVAQRTREFGVRIALGATGATVVRQVLREGLWLALPGVVLGTIAALIAGRIMARLLFGIGAADPATYAITALVQALVALAACALPAYRATKASPIVALRQE